MFISMFFCFSSPSMRLLRVEKVAKIKNFSQILNYRKIVFNKLSHLATNAVSGLTQWYINSSYHLLVSTIRHTLEPTITAVF